MDRYTNSGSLNGSKIELKQSERQNDGTVVNNKYQVDIDLSELRTVFAPSWYEGE